MNNAVVKVLDDEIGHSENIIDAFLIVLISIFDLYYMQILTHNHILSQCYFFR